LKRNNIISSRRGSDHIDIIVHIASARILAIAENEIYDESRGGETPMTGNTRRTIGNLLMSGGRERMKDQPRCRLHHHTTNLMSPHVRSSNGLMCHRPIPSKYQQPSRSCHRYSNLKRKLSKHILKTSNMDGLMMDLRPRRKVNNKDFRQPDGLLIGSSRNGQRHQMMYTEEDGRDQKLNLTNRGFVSIYLETARARHLLHTNRKDGQRDHQSRRWRLSHGRSWMEDMF